MARTPIDGDDRYLARVVRVLETFDSELAVHRVGDIVAATGLPTATAYRIVADLVAYGFLSRDADGRIRLGSRLWELANRGSPLTDLREAARVEIMGVHAATGFHTNLAVLREGTVLVVDRIVADTPLRNRSVPATRQSALRSSLGLAMLAHAPYAQLRLALALEHARASETSGIDADEAFADDEREASRTLERVRRIRHATQRGKQDANTMGVAVPVFGARGEVVAALGVIMPVESTAASELAAAERLRLAAGRVGGRLERGARTSGAGER